MGAREEQKMSAMSYVSGVADRPLLGETIGRQFDRTVERWGDRLGLVVRQQGVRLTWRELQGRVDAFAAGLLALGLRPGDRVGIWSPNKAEWVITQFATAKAGLVLVNINPAYRLHELEFALNKVGCRAVVTATGFKSSDYAGMLLSLLPELADARPGALRAARVPTLEIVIQIGARSIPGSFAFEDVAAMGGEAERAALADLAATLAALPPDATAEAIQDEVYAVGKRHPFAALKDWFGCLYQVLLGQQEGPRFGGFVALYGIAETVALIESALARPAQAA